MAQPLALALATVIALAAAIPTTRFEPGAIQGQARLESGEPLPDVAIRVRNTIRDTTMRTETDADGFYRVDLAPGRYSITAAAERYGSIWIPEIVVNSGQRVTQDLVFSTAVVRAAP